MADATWTYDISSRRYRNAQTGRYLSAASSIELRDDVVTRLRSDAEALARRLADQDLTVQQWEAEMQRAVSSANTVQWAFGRGGRHAMTDDDLAALADLIRSQHQYLRAFAEDAAAGKLSEAQIAARSKLYYASSVQAYERGRAAAWNVVPPHVPGDGSTPCGANCKCAISYRETDDTVELRWKLQSGESCSGCKRRARDWSPLVIAKTTEGRTARLWRAVA